MENKTAVLALAALAQETRLAIFRLLIAAGGDGVSAGRIGEELEVSRRNPFVSSERAGAFGFGVFAPREAVYLFCGRL